jgi:type I restriction enzyme, S subunit
VTAQTLPPLPSGWVWTTIGEICIPPQYGWTTSASSQGKIKLLRTTDITSGNINWPSVPYCEKEPDDIDKYLLHDGDIVISRAGSIGYSVLVKRPEKSVFASYLIRFRPFSLVYEKYLAYFLNSPTYWEAISVNSIGIAISNVNASKLRQIPIPLAPLPDQQRIVAKIEELFTQFDAAETALRRAKANLERYRRSVLQAAVTGELTRIWREEHHGQIEPADELLQRIRAERKTRWQEEMRAKGKDPAKVKYEEPKESDTNSLPELPEGWVWATTDQMFDFITSGSRGWARYYSDSGATFLRIGNLDHDSIDLDLRDIQKVSLPNTTEGMRTLVAKNDILISITADVGMIGLVPGNIGEAYINQHISLARPVELINARYLAWFLASQSGQKQFTDLQRGATKMGLGLDDIKCINVPLPPLQEQEKIVMEIQRQLTIAKNQNELSDHSLHRISRLRQSILEEAFQGRLVDQNPEDEPASELLQRIQAEREEREKQQAAKPKKERKKMTEEKKRKPLVETLHAVGIRLTPEELFRRAGFDEESVDEFYEELRQELQIGMNGKVIKPGRIKEDRPNQTDIYLSEAKS